MYMYMWMLRRNMAYQPSLTSQTVAFLRDPDMQIAIYFLTFSFYDT